MARLPNFLVIIRSEKLSGKGQGRGVGVRKKERFVLGKRTFRSQKSKHFVLRIIHPETELGNEVFLKMRSEDFLEKLEDIRNDYGSALRKILKFNEKTTDYIEKRKSEMNLPVDYIAVHIRRGDKIVSREMKELGLSLYIDAVKGKKHISRNVFIATDDGSVTDKLKSALVAEGFNVYWNTAVTQTGFDESLFNTKDKKSRYIDTLNMLLDMDILIHSSFFIGTYTSNVSRIVPLYVGFEKSLSLDDEWKL